ncbi:protein of unknown function (plasmid) [Cupriavidus taiwanensis]|uniref:Uncharacterized protein n=1 Tax=Cupriavidus taiwanensis TaxID=164546 RepID=A0A7Z7JE38_9BURK|nr:protein of unknown function [Cupriavidus taiwanensis]SOZ12784.1 protein of unknown function [Cupriavidus taiwanensis]SOZ41276.1 protein of unknown function [Cupriavidus taiwanensis]SPC23536.1 protein of unknown function [Cupriavidus taiwanensis]SPD54833.1 protein of unknown function [Cupriavidus taiwanensis]
MGTGGHGPGAVCRARLRACLRAVHRGPGRHPIGGRRDRRAGGGSGSAFGRLSYDLFVGTPVYKPTQFQTAAVTGGMQVIYQY